MSEMIATRVAFGKALAEIGKDENIVVLNADLSKSTRTDFFRIYILKGISIWE